MNKILIICFFIFISEMIFSQEQEFAYFADDTLPESNLRLKEIPVRAYTADEILNGSIKWDNPYQTVNNIATEGFDKSKLGKIPAIGIYPRIFTSPVEFRSIKLRLEKTRTGKQLLDLATKELTDMRLGKGNAGKWYSLLKQNELVETDNESTLKNLENMLAIQGLLAQINNDKTLLNETGLVSANLIKNKIRQIKLNPQLPTKIQEVKEEIYSGGRLAKLFDFTAAGMSEEAKKEFIRFFVNETSGKYGDGMNLPHHWRRWNHIAMSLAYPLSVLSVEGQPGYDKRIYDRGVELMQDYLTYTYSPEGMSTEGMTYTFGPFADDLLFMAAIARRGKPEIFANPHFRAIPDWMIYSLSPNPAALWITHGDTGSATQIPWEMMMYLKFFFPSDARIDYLLANAMPNEIRILPDVGAFVFTADADKTSVDYNGEPPLSLNLTYFSPTRGSFIARDKWTKDGTCFQFDARQDMLFQSHDHSDRGNFELAANGRLWVVDGWRSTETKYHSCITIDGRGQGYFATPACWKSYFDKPEATFGSVDYKYAFDWMWIKSPVADIMNGKKVNPMWQNGVYSETAKRLESYYPGVKPKRDPLRKVADYYSGCLETNPLIWHEDTWPMRLPNYEVEYAFRTAGLVKGKHSYVLIIDDLKKDNQERLYEWNMPMPLDVEVVSIKQLLQVTQGKEAKNLGWNSFEGKGVHGEYDIVLGDKRMKRNMKEVDDQPSETYQAGRFIPSKGDPQLLVRVLECAHAPRPNLEPNPRLEVIEKLKTEDMHQFYLRTMDIGKRLVIPSRSTQADFKVLLFPHLYGEEIPETSWNEDHTRLTVTFSDQKDEFIFSKGADNQTYVKIMPRK